MKTRSATTKKNPRSGHGDSSKSTSFDKKLWGTLQHHIDLAENVYSKLPFEEFFHLRTVCKDWYSIACKRLGLEEPVLKPFFTLFTKGWGGQLEGILLYNGTTRSWEWRPSWYHNQYFDMVASKGMVYATGDKDIGNSACVFYWQNELLQNLALPPALAPPPVVALRPCMAPRPARPNTHKKMILGMSVSDDNQGFFSSFRSFRVVRGSQDYDTQVYESGEWQTKPCRVPKLESGGPLRTSTGCAHCNGRVYITTEHTREVFVYDFEGAKWSSLRSPCDWVSNLQPQLYCLDTLGAWNGRIFDVTCDHPNGRREKNWSLQVWELVDESQHKWQVYDCMSKGLCSWLRSTKGFLPVKSKVADVSLQASFCGDFLLVYSWDFSIGAAGRFCLFNMITKNWQMLNIAAGTVGITEELPSDVDSEDSDALFDFGDYGNESSMDEFITDDDDDGMDSDSL